MLFVNRRAVEWKNFYFAINNAYGNLIPRGHFPAVFLFIDISPGNIDVNVHPMKREVRFHDENKIMKVLQDSINKAITNESGITEAEDGITGFTPYEKKVSDAIRGFMTENRTDINNQYGKYISKETLFHPSKVGNLLIDNKTGDVETGKPVTFHKTTIQEDTASLMDYRFVGVVFQTFIIMEGEDSIILLDQHALHERINYEKFKERYRNKLLSPNELLIPITVDVPQIIVEDLKDNLGILESMGFEVEYFGGTSFIVRSSPAYIDYNDVGEVVMGFVETLEENSNAHSADFIDGALKQMACKASVRSGDSLSKEEALALIKEWESTENRFSCPHGRPVLFSISRKDMEKQFKRLGF